MGLLDYIEDNWRDSYRPFTKYPKIYGEHVEQGIGLLAEEGQGWSSLYKKPLGLLNISAIPSLYEAFRDEPIRNTLISDLDIDPKTAGYATQAIGLGMDVGVPYAVIRKGLTPWISEQVAKQANPTGFSPSRRRFLKGTGAAAVGTATGIPLLKQVAKTVPDAFGSLMGQMSSHLGSVGVADSVAMGMEGFRRKFADLADHLVDMRRHREDMIADPLKKKWKPGKGGPSWARKLRVYRKAHPVKESEKTRAYYTGNDAELTAMRNFIEDQVHRNRAEWLARNPSIPKWKHDYIPNFGTTNRSFGHVERAKAHYEADPKGFILALENKIKVLKEGTRHRTAKMRSGKLGPYEAKQLGWYTEDNASLVAKLEDFLKELKAGL